MSLLFGSALVERAREIAYRVHAGHFRRDGVTPYVEHLQDVVARLEQMGLDDPEYLAAAWLHDSIEDGRLSSDELLSHKEFPFSVPITVHALTKRPGERYADYIARVKVVVIARHVKIADIISNLADDPTPRQLKRYSWALNYLFTDSVYLGK